MNERLTPSNACYCSNSDRALPLLEDWMLADFRQSAIPDRLTTANVQVLCGDDAIQAILEDKIAQSQTVTSYITVGVQRLLKIYEPLRDGMWCTREGIPYAKPFHPRPDPHKLGKTIKYETPPGAVAEPILPRVDDVTAATLYERYDVTPLPGQDFWTVVEQNNLPVAIAEGLKKALALIAHGIPAIAVRGITQWHVKGSLQLHAALERFATKGRRLFIVFDQDTKPRTIANVHRQVKQLGRVLDCHGCQVRCPIWQPQEGKGIDDVLYRYSDAAKAAGSGDTVNTETSEQPSEVTKGFSTLVRSHQHYQDPNYQDPIACPSPDRACQLTGAERLHELLNAAPTLKQYKRSGQIAAALNAIHRHNALTFPIERRTEGPYLPPLPELTPGVIHVVDATMNTGKTYRIGCDWVHTALTEDKHVLVLSPLNALGQQTAQDWGILHIHDQGTTGQRQRDFWNAVRQRPGLVLCPDSIGKLPEWFWTKPVVLIVDEGNQVTEHICQGDTFNSRYGAILKQIVSVAKHAIASGGAIVLSEDGLPNRAVQFWQAISESLAVRCFQHRKQGISWDCHVFSGQASGFRQRLLHRIEQGSRLLVVTSSQREAKRLDRILQGQGIHTTRIDSETNEGETFNLFFKDPDRWLQVNQPEVLILSPSAKSGVSIEGQVAVEDAYFDEVWAYFPALSTDTHLQLLGRYRPAVPRQIFIPPFITGTAEEALGSPRAIKQRLSQNLITLARLFDIGTRDHPLAGVESAIVDYLTVARTVSGSQKAIAQAALIDRLDGAGHCVTAATVSAHKATAQLWHATQKQIWLEEALEIAEAEPQAGHTPDWAHRTLNGMESSREVRLIAYKVLYRAEFPGIDFNDADECYDVLCNNYGALRRGVLLQAQAENLEAVKNCDLKIMESILASSIRAPHQLPRRYVKAGIIAKLGVLKLLDGNPWTNYDKRAIAIKQVALRFIHEVRYWLNLTINPDQTPCQIANKLVKRLGLEVVAISRPGRRNRKRARRYALPDLENPLRLKLLQAVRHKLSASVSTISIRDPIPNQEIMDTGSHGALYSRLTPDSQSWQIGDRVQSGQIFRRERCALAKPPSMTSTQLSHAEYP